MRISQLAKDIGVSTDLLRYMETKGFVCPSRVKLQKRVIRDYSEEDVLLIKIMAKYLDEGFKLDMAHEKAKLEIQNPRLV